MAALSNDLPVSFKKMCIHLFTIKITVRPDLNDTLEPRNFVYMRLINKPYENEVTLTGQNQPLKCCQPLELFTQLKRSLDL